MSKSSQDIIDSRCNNCQAKTRHEVLKEVMDNGGDEYHCTIQYAIIECRGCGRKSFRYNFTDFEQAFPISDEEWDIPQEIKQYPRFKDNLLEIEGIELVPNIVAEIYNETISAIHEDALILAGLGLRGTIEAVCNDQEISGRNLQYRIKNLVTKGLISKQDSERLHAIRFLGNDAAHEIKKPKKSQINVAVKIVKHLIASVYTLRQEADGTLDTLITEYDEYVAAIEEKLGDFDKGDELSVNALLGRDIRRVGDNKADLESRLISEIQSGAYNKLKIGKMDKIANSKEDFQHFIIK